MRVWQEHNVIIFSLREKTELNWNVIEFICQLSWQITPDEPQPIYICSIWIYLSLMSIAFFKQMFPDTNCFENNVALSQFKLLLWISK